MARAGYNGFSGEDIVRSSRIQSTALRNGTLERIWNCSVCDIRGEKPGHIIAHLEDYSDPVDGAIWVCYRCHTVLHLKDEYWDQFNHYREVVGRGGQYPRVASRRRVIEDLLNPPFLMKAPLGERRETILDRIARGEFNDMSERDDVKERLRAMREKGYQGLLDLKSAAQPSLF